MGGITCCQPLRLIQACSASRIHWCLSWPPAVAKGTCKQGTQIASKHADTHVHTSACCCANDWQSRPHNVESLDSTAALHGCLLLSATHQAKPAAMLAASEATVDSKRHTAVANLVLLLGHAGPVYANAMPLLLHVASLAAAHGCGFSGLESALTHARLRCGYSGQTSSSSATFITNMCARQRPWCRFLLWDCLLLAKGKVPTSGSCTVQAAGVTWAVPVSRGLHSQC